MSALLSTLALDLAVDLHDHAEVTDKLLDFIGFLHEIAEKEARRGGVVRDHVGERELEALRNFDDSDKINLVRHKLQTACNESFDMVEQMGAAPGAKWGDLISGVWSMHGDLAMASMGGANENHPGAKGRVNSRDVPSIMTVSGSPLRVDTTNSATVAVSPQSAHSG